MKYSNEIRGGYFWSFLSPLIVTFLLSIYGAISEAIDTSVMGGIGVFFGMFALFGFFSILFSGLFCGLVGIPIYYALRRLGLANWLVATIIGGSVAYIYSLADGQNTFFTVLFVIYGSCSGFFFWFGTSRPLSSNKSINYRLTAPDAKKTRASYGRVMRKSSNK